MTIGEKIKKLRKEHDITQEKLAEYLNITYQAVSKWENGSAMPDITLVVPIANFFGISTDTLFDINSKTENEETKEIEKKGAEIAHKGSIPERLEHWRKAVEKYPRNYSFLNKLAASLWQNAVDGSLYDQPELTKNYLLEAVSICLRIEEDCTDDELRASSRQILVFSYDQLGEEEKAVEAAMKATEMYYSKNMLLPHAYSNGEKKTQKIQELIEDLMGSLASDLRYIKYDTNDEQILAVETAINLIKLIIYDGNYGFYNCQILFLLCELIECHVKNQDKAKIMEALHEAKICAAASDRIWNSKEKLSYTNIFMNRIKLDSSDFSRNYTETHMDTLKQMIHKKSFDFIRDDSDFIEFEKSL